MKIADIVRQVLAEEQSDPDLIEKVLAHADKMFPLANFNHVPSERIEELRAMFRLYLQISQSLPIEKVENYVRNEEASHQAKQN